LLEHQALNGLGERHHEQNVFKFLDLLFGCIYIVTLGMDGFGLVSGRIRSRTVAKLKGFWLTTCNCAGSNPVGGHDGRAG
jgi:hypothetical protein